ncbi:MAG: RNA polymerase subunit sigma-24 [Deltaproteobacteria bacterium RIFCSPLOWO2_02_56_12]|nr:MAG: RNA polymerase subunit sigma-24 [Deltaproteobacteria bacterium GWD2_55_8]OGP98931.1 MAG: RNA polymerase subunit sigma-24 [Deltaproteobacteria bacterium RBG_16_55_12]OGQ51663.1 MAG: RNA polymerase subunit sigma-24 [Deltaproteobacteria bacterium RIFCSPLOWO2_02_56_12]OGQ93292.1 MAG: RNA polymerase subunit sigma-24 [Deltaproteobacteria bacterium RIFOXYA2_FULL_55_11]HBA38762.1 RNA polymerase subunit sigma-24 [Deltaproteobacteria bacterium]
MGNDEHIATHIPQLRRYARALTGDYSAAEDLVQDTLERAWKRIGLWRLGSDLRAWLFTIMHNLHVNQLKADSRQQGQPPEQATLDLSVRPTQEDRLELRDLNKALRRLSNEQREVLLLVGLEQMSYEEVAKVLGIPIGTVMSRLSRGRDQLRAMMEGSSAAPQLKVIK